CPRHSLLLFFRLFFVVVTFLINTSKLQRVYADYFKLCAALVAQDYIAFFDFIFFEIEWAIALYTYCHCQCLQPALYGMMMEQNSVVQLR
ncbi:MAG: hypothetical protein ACYC0Z_08295, partial [Acidobacteriaceae bacterium]